MIPFGYSPNYYLTINKIKYMLMLRKRVLLMMCLLLATAGLYARPVTESHARVVGAAWLRAMGHADASQLQPVKTPFSGFYVFNAGDHGFVLVADDDCVRPILGYSLTGTFPAGDLPTNVRGWLEGYEQEIAAIKQAAKESDGQAASHASPSDWHLLESNITPEPRLLTSVSPMLGTTWNQSPIYNDMCPYDSTFNQRVVTGCVATATAQIMKYWNYPTTGYGSHSYHATNSHADYGILSADFGATTYLWNNMPAALTSVSSQSEIDAVATLMSHVGIAVEMMYNVSSEGGSGAYNYDWSGEFSNPSAQLALLKYFKYASDMVWVARSSCDNDTYCAIMRSELDHERPILYSGSHTSGGHSFVCDGYDSWGDFHFNWGWGGAYDGYFSIGALNPRGGGDGSNSSGTYNMSNVILTGIRPNPEFGSSSTVTVTTTGGNAACSASGSGSYNFGDTVTLSAVAGTGYFFAGWDDNSIANPHTLIVNGGTFNFNARFEPVGSDTMSYCGKKGLLNYWGESAYGAEKYWGIRLPASTLTPGRTLSAVEFYVGDAYYNTGGSYDLTIYARNVGDSVMTDTVYSTTVWPEYADQNSWYSVFLPTPYTVPAGKDLFITFHNADLYYPATVTSGCGNPDGFLYGPSFLPDPDWTRFSYLIRGRFDTPGTTAAGDTLSYCGNRACLYNEAVGEWGILIPSADLSGRNYLTGAKLYANYPGVYTLHVYKGGAGAPHTLVHSQPARITQNGWNDITLDATIPIGATDSLWMTFSCPEASWPAAVCHYTGNDNSNWFSWGDGYWGHMNNVSWLLKAVTSATAPTLPPPTVIIQGNPYVGVGTPATLTAAHSVGTTVHWSFSGATTATATGDTVSVTWNQTGSFQVSASVTSTHGDSTDYFWMTVVDCNQAITEYPYVLSFEKNDNMVCVEVLDGNNDGSGWEPYRYSYYQGYQSFFSPGTRWNGSSEEPLAVDDWMFLPKMATLDYGSYLLTWYARTGWGNPTYAHYGLFIDTTAGNDPSHYLLLQEFTIEDSNNGWQQQGVDLSAFAGKTFRLAFRHYNSNVGSEGLYLDNLYLSESVPNFYEGDTLSYCGYHVREGSLGYTQGATHWGISFSPEQLTGRDSLRSVLFFVHTDGNYTLNIWQGGQYAPDTLLYTTTRYYSDVFDWQTIDLESAVAFDSTQPLWITFYSDAPYPAARTSQANGVNSDWISSNGYEWAHAADYNFTLSWLIKAVITSGAREPQTPHYTVTVHYDLAMGTVDLVGADTAGSTVTLTATSFQGFRFVAWMEAADTLTTDNVYVIDSLDRDRVLTALFDSIPAGPNAIDLLDRSALAVWSSGDFIHVSGAEGRTVTVYDLSGRELHRTAQAAARHRFRMPHSGVYLVKVGTAPAQRVVVVR